MKDVPTGFGFTFSAAAFPTNTLTCGSCPRYFKWQEERGVGIDSMPEEIGVAAEEHFRAHALEHRVAVIERHLAETAVAQRALKQIATVGTEMLDAFAASVQKIGKPEI